MDNVTLNSEIATSSEGLEQGEVKVPCLVMARVVGYYAAVQDFNIGKKEEFRDRKMFNLETSRFVTGGSDA